MDDPVTVLIPAYNEEKALGDVLGKVSSALNEAHIDHELLVVDDGSEDKTSSIAQSAGARLIRHSVNKGYGAALKTGVQSAQYESIVIMDADGTYPVWCLPELIDKMQTSDMVVGARTSKHVNIQLVRRPAKWILRRLAEYVSAHHIPDLNSGLRVLRRSLVTQYMDILPDKFSFTTTLTVATLCDGYEISYFPIDYYKRIGKSKIVAGDFFNFITLVLRLSMLFKPLKVFVPVASFLAIIGILKLVWDISTRLILSPEFSWKVFATGMISATAIFLLLASLQVILLGVVADGVVRLLYRANLHGLYHSVNEKNEFRK